MSDYTIIHADDVGTTTRAASVPGEFRRLADALGTEQVAVTLLRIPPHSDFEQGTGHYHEQQEEVYIVTRGTLTMRFGDDIRAGDRRLGRARARRDAALAPQRGRRARRDVGDLTPASRGDAVKLDDFWAASPDAEQHRGAAG